MYRLMSCEGIANFAILAGPQWPQQPQRPTILHPTWSVGRSDGQSLMVGHSSLYIIYYVEMKVTLNNLMVLKNTLVSE